MAAKVSRIYLDQRPIPQLRAKRKAAQVSAARAARRHKRNPASADTAHVWRKIADNYDELIEIIQDHIISIR